MSEAEGVKLVKEALFEGVIFFDTAPNYGNGMSENMLGKSFPEKERSFSGRRDSYVKKNSYAQEVSFSSVIDSAISLLKMMSE